MGRLPFLVSPAQRQMASAPAEPKFDIERARREARAPAATAIAELTGLPPDVADIAADYGYLPTRGVVIRKWDADVVRQYGIKNFELVGDVTVRPNGDCLVACNHTGRVVVLHADGTVSSWPRKPDGPDRIRYNGLSVNPVDGLIYAAHPVSPRASVGAFTPDGTCVRQWGEEKTRTRPLNHPIACACGPDGRVYVVDTAEAGESVAVFERDGTDVDRWFALVPDGYDTMDVGSICVGPDSLLYMTDMRLGQVSVFTPTGRLVRSWDGKESPNARLCDPKGIAYTDRFGTVCVTDGGQYRLKLFLLDGTFVCDVGKVGASADPEEIGPIGVLHASDWGEAAYTSCAFGPNGVLYAAEWENATVVAIALV